MAKKRAHLLSAVNAANISKTGGVYTIKGVCGAVDDIVMNRRLYPADALSKAVSSMNGKPAPAGHPKNAKGQHISALNGEALASAWIGSYCTNARHEGGRSLFDVLVNEAQAMAHPDGAKLCARLDAAIAGTNADPVHVSTGLFFDAIAANGESLGKKYDTIVTSIEYDHLAILLNEKGAGTPEEGVGMFLNAAGEEEEIEEVEVNTDPADRRYEGLTGWLRKLVANGTDLSFDQIRDSLYAGLPKGAWIREVYAKYLVWTDQADVCWKQDYAVGSDGSLSFTSQPQEVKREVAYVPITNSNEVDPLKEQILAALNAAGIAVAGLDDTQLLLAYNSMVIKPTQEKLTAANSKLAEVELAANAAKDAELTALANELAVNTSLKPEDFKAMGLDRCKELKATKTAAPILPGNQSASNSADDEFKDYDINKL